MTRQESKKFSEARKLAIEYVKTNQGEQAFYSAKCSAILVDLNSMPERIKEYAHTLIFSMFEQRNYSQLIVPINELVKN